MISTVTNTWWNIQVVIYRIKKKKKEEEKKKYNPEYILEIQAPHNSKNCFYFGRFVTIVVHEYVVVVVVFDCT
jgi:hypothetical protein